MVAADCIMVNVGCAAWQQVSFKVLGGLEYCFLRFWKMNIKGKMLVGLETGVKAVPLVEVKQYARGSCSFCWDFSSELADISVGGLGLDGWTFVVIRTKEGEEIFEEAEKALVLKTRSVEKEEAALSLLFKLSNRKRRLARLV